MISTAKRWILFHSACEQAHDRPPTSMTAPAHHVTFRAARRDDLTEIVRLLADDDLGQSRERYE
ncbi:MAG: hypothetical protein OET79_06240, partial [Nitrospirota bacterium]|nr:hypothetical protein [Nitrospirota bacterium]